MNKRTCNICGNLCYGKTCLDCFRTNTHGGISRVYVMRKHNGEMKK